MTKYTSKFLAAGIVFLCACSVYSASTGYTVQSTDDVIADGNYSATVTGIMDNYGISAGIGSGVSISVENPATSSVIGIYIDGTNPVGDIAAAISAQAAESAIGISLETGGRVNSFSGNMTVNTTGNNGAYGIFLWDSSIGDISGSIKVTGETSSTTGIYSTSSGSTVGNILAGATIDVSGTIALGLDITQDSLAVYGSVIAKGDQANALNLRGGGMYFNLTLGGDAYLAADGISKSNAIVTSSFLTITGDANTQTLKGNVSATKITFNAGNYAFDSFGDEFTLYATNAKSTGIVLNDGANLIFLKSGHIDTKYVQFYAKTLDDRTTITLENDSQLTLNDGSILTIVLSDQLAPVDGDMIDFVVGDQDGSVVGSFSQVIVRHEDGRIIDSSLYTFDSATGILLFIPEPSAFAAFFGLAGIAIAIARRRKN